MNFMGSSSGRPAGFLEEKEQGKFPPPNSSSSSPSPSSSNSHQQQQKGLVPLPYYQHQHHRGWLDNHGGEGGSSSQLELMMMDSSPAVLNTANNDGTGGDDGDGRDEESCHHQLIHRGSGEGVGTVAVVEREHMFDKVVTPSDVGKLNRLVIPKQHAERYFPLDSTTNEKGLLLNFEDRNGKPWRFRYSYWNSSQSYVMTKGWSRFVKEKKLDAGDIVSFHRGVGDLAKDRLFIDWRRRPDAPSPGLLTPLVPHNLSYPPQHYSFQHNNRSNYMNNIHPWNPLFLHPPQTLQPQPLPPQRMLRPFNNNTNTNSYSYGDGSSGGPYGYSQCSGSVIYFRSEAPQQQQQQQVGMVQMQRGGGVGVGVGIDPPVVFESVPVVHGKAAAKRLRLFGVNMDCPISEEDDDQNECQILPQPTATTNLIPHNNAYPQHLSPSSIPYLQLRPYDGTPLPTTVSSSDFLNKSKASMSLDLDM